MPPNAPLIRARHTYSSAWRLPGSPQGEENPLLQTYACRRCTSVRALDDDRQLENLPANFATQTNTLVQLELQLVELSRRRLRAVVRNEITRSCRPPLRRRGNRELIVL